MITKDELAAMIAALESQPHLSMKEEKYLRVIRHCLELQIASRRAHDMLVEINEHNYNHEDVVNLNNASVEAILTLAPCLGETHGRSEMWWASRLFE